VKFSTHPHRVPRLRMRGALPPLLLYAFIPWTATALPLPCPFRAQTKDPYRYRITDGIRYLPGFIYTRVSALSYFSEIQGFQHNMAVLGAGCVRVCALDVANVCPLVNKESFVSVLKPRQVAQPLEIIRHRTATSRDNDMLQKQL